MSTNKESKDLFKSSQLILLISYTIFSAILITESLLMEWERWPLLIIAGCVVVAWILHIRHDVPSDVRLWIYSLMIAGSFFFYGIHPASTFDLAIVMAAVIILITMTGRKPLIALCVFTYFFTMGYELILMITDKDKDFNMLILTRVILHFVMVLFIGKFAATIVDKWTLVINNSQEEMKQRNIANEHLNDFLANLSHELRTPVNAIIGLTSLCIEKSKNREVQGDLISVRDAGRKVATQITDILDFSEIDRNKAVCNNEDYMISSVLHDIIVDLNQYKGENVELILDVDPSIPAVMNSDADKIKKILKILITNGLKFTSQGAVYVRIATENRDYGINLCIEVTDTGKGMDAAQLDLIRRNCYQSGSTHTGLGGGLGLGLAIASGFISLLGGFMTIESKLDVGTTVNVSIPQRVIDPSSCMSVASTDKLCPATFINVEKNENPMVREYYNSTIYNTTRSLGITMHKATNLNNLKLLNDSVHLTHLFVGEAEYKENADYLEKLAKNMVVAVFADESLRLPNGSRVRLMAKPFYCFPVVSLINSTLDNKDKQNKRLLCKDVRALVVDDESMNLIVAKSVFGRYEMNVSTVTSGQEAIDICRENVFDIIFMDHMMSGMDGVEAMKRIKTDITGLNGSVPIVALTANAMSSSKQMFLNEGFDGFVSKPIEIEQLERVLKQVLPKNAITYVDYENVNVTTEIEVTESEEPVVPEEIDFIKELGKLGLDTESGLKYCADDKEFYKTFLIQFSNEAKTKCATIDNYYSIRDWYNYEILVHALKSTALTAGIGELSRRAKALEIAAKQTDDKYILENHGKMISYYLQITEDILGKLTEPEPGKSEDDEIFEFAPESDGGDDA
ncbi:MAG: response regulator [Saccharofermentans sp.]|nr:response regulator [Saccharofermentans sp.]